MGTGEPACPRYHREYSIAKSYRQDTQLELFHRCAFAHSNMQTYRPCRLESGCRCFVATGPYISYLPYTTCQTDLGRLILFASYNNMSHTDIFTLHQLLQTTFTRWAEELVLNSHCAGAGDGAGPGTLMVDLIWKMPADHTKHPIGRVRYETS